MEITFPPEKIEHLKAFIQQQVFSLGIPQEVMDQFEITGNHNLYIRFLGHTATLELIRRLALEVSSWLPFDEFSLEDIGLAIDEACTNVIRHSYQNRIGPIELEFALQGQEWVITLRDFGETGRDFRLEALTNVDEKLYLQKLNKGGLGVHLIKKIMDNVEYRILEGEVNCLRMSKWLTCQSS